MPLHQGSKRKQTQYQADKILNKNGKEGKAGGKQGNLKSFPYHQKRSLRIMKIKSFFIQFCLTLIKVPVRLLLITS